MTDRDENGRFLKGAYKGGPGRKSRRTEAQYLDATIGAVSLIEWRKVVQKALTDAIAGDGTARRWLSDYLLGKPPQILELHGSDAHALSELLDHMKQHGVSAGELFGAMLAEIAAQGDEGENDGGE